MVNKNKMELRDKLPCKPRIYSFGYSSVNTLDTQKIGIAKPYIEC